ncbi:rRNA maturation RNase YbeY [Sporosarcina sp. HYO08]|uniref:rRNA maturation RNase YbeY n=1 Tax=Sporosarcina sp. HYO08 TaxID=1759557 RepID=UPI000796C59A|nr:rRNA maturation RNase YbeY [Sporosarcina sp. HYO08]KXH87408.1 rRNA maturation factor [Sporosarcina sp. HYO08]
MLELYFDDERETVGEEIKSLITNVLNHAAKKEGIQRQSEVSITFMSDAEIQEVNAQYRGKNQPTDVISFALEELSEGEVAIVSEEGMPTVLGDIIISIDTAKRQAEEYGHSMEREMGFLALHGFLHLLGYDHLTEEEEKEMFGRQQDILSSFGLER